MPTPPLTTSSPRPPRPRPAVLLVCGPPGSGKSTVGAVLAQRLAAALVDLDTATLPLTQVVGALVGTHDLDDPALVALTRESRYATLVDLVLDNVRVGLGVVAVAPFTTERRDPGAWAALRGRVEAAGGEATLVWLRVPAHEAARRVAARAAPRDLAKPGSTGAPGAGPVGPDDEPPLVAHLEADALLPPDLLAERIVAALGRPAPNGPAVVTGPRDGRPGG